MRTNISTSATLPLHHISYLVLYRVFVGSPLIQKTILNMNLPTRLVGLQRPHGVYELNSALFLLYCLFSGSFYNPLNLFDIHTDNFLDGHIELTNKVPSTFSRLRVSLQWKPVHFSLCQYILVYS